MFRIHEICKEKGLTLQQLAKKLGVSYQAVHAVMNGNPTISKLQEFANALGVSVTELIEEPANPGYTCNLEMVG